MEKMGIWKYSPAQMKPQIHVDLYGKIKARWDSTMQSIKEMGENFEKVLDNYFEVFKEKMNNRFWIPPKLVEDYKDDICFMVECDRVYIQAVIPRVAWVKPLPYEVNIDEARDIIEALVNELAIPHVPTFGTYEESKKRIELSIKIPQAISKGRKRVAKL